MGYVVRDTENRELRCPLSTGEVQQRAERVAELLEQAETIEAEQSAAKARFKSRLEEVAREKRIVLGEFRTRTTLREVPCELQLDLVAKRAQWVRTDTGEVIVERGLRDEERQPGLFDADPGEVGEAGDEEAAATLAAGAEQDREEAPEPAGRRGRRGRRGEQGAEGETGRAGTV